MCYRTFTKHLDTKRMRFNKNNTNKDFDINAIPPIKMIETISVYFKDELINNGNLSKNTKSHIVKLFLLLKINIHKVDKEIETYKVLMLEAKKNNPEWFAEVEAQFKSILKNG